MARASVEDPLKVHRFRVVVDGFVKQGFQKCNLPGQQIEEVSYREGGMNDTLQKSAGLSKFGNLVLTRGQIVGSQLNSGGDNDFFNWVQEVMSVVAQGNAFNYRKDLNIEQYNAQNTRVRAWTVVECFPTDWKPFSDLNAETSENCVESLTCANEGFIRTL